MTSEDEYGHEPVLIDEVMKCLQPKGSGVYIDCTFGRGGYSEAILKLIDQDGLVLAIDADPDAIEYGKKVFASEPRMVLRHSNYDKIVEVAEELDVEKKVQGIVFDLGVSSPQLDDANRGFSFRNEGPLDMRMNPETGLSAQEWINSAEPGDIRRVIQRFGEEPYADRVARKIIEYRSENVIKTTTQLSEIIYKAIPEKERSKRKLHPATKVFQAIRMYVNDELGHLEKGLKASAELLQIGATLVVVTFHSLEDRIVKRYFRYLVEGEKVPDKVPLLNTQMGGDYEYVSKITKPTEIEISQNPRARSAKLRAVRKFR